MRDTAATTRTTTHVGGVRWGKAYATWPMARLVIEPRGIRIEPSHKALSPAFRLVGLTELEFDWHDIESVFPSEGLVPAWLINNGISFVVFGRALTWWSPTGRDAKKILAEVGEIAPEKLRSPVPDG